MKELIFVLRENVERIVHLREICIRAQNLIHALERNIHVQEFSNALLFINENPLKTFSKFSVGIVL